MKPDINSKFTRSALAHVTSRKRDLGNTLASWYEVAHAYDQGLRHGTSTALRKRAREMLLEIDRQPNSAPGSRS